MSYQLADSHNVGFSLNHPRDSCMPEVMVGQTFKLLEMKPCETYLG